MSTFTMEWLQNTITSIESARDEMPFGLDNDQAHMLTAFKIALTSLERERVRHEHAKWSDSTFGCVGPIGPLKHLSKEALEAAAEPDDLSEWADMQFLLWDAQRRAGISDAEITAAMENKLKINMERQWPEPKDGEPRLHIKEPGNSPVTPDGWISCSELMPDDGQHVIILCDGAFVLYAQYRDGEFFDIVRNGDEFFETQSRNVTDWMQLPELILPSNSGHAAK
ncbi:TPA: dATP/dGTP pyrophosphohydrolase domain-containing protein [Escherichia coli]